MGLRGGAKTIAADSRGSTANTAATTSTTATTGGATLENWDASDCLSYIPKRGPTLRSKAEKRRARRERRRVYGRGQPQRPRSPEPGRPIPGQEQLLNNMGWLEEYIRIRGAKRAEEQASNAGRIINIIL
ncbi:hypothetical protein TKK_0013729 [Trichogramma kaykai]|uniref:Uncharacterized protein n=1 Tax=Trichogramma kaykai TaxID=54128 RepID=A0ABD2WH47_9HYME